MLVCTPIDMVVVYVGRIRRLQQMESLPIARMYTTAPGATRNHWETAAHHDLHVHKVLVVALHLLLGVVRQLAVPHQPKRQTCMQKHARV